MERYLRINDLAHEYGGCLPLSKMQLYRLMKVGKFPQNVELSDGGRVAWKQSEVEAWLEERERKTNEKRAAA
jgi:predicted DNA-binding transcriptional regulator AlpA